MSYERKVKLKAGPVHEKLTEKVLFPCSAKKPPTTRTLFTLTSSSGGTKKTEHKNCQNLLQLLLRSAHTRGHVAGTCSGDKPFSIHYIGACCRDSKHAGAHEAN